MKKLYYFILSFSLLGAGLVYAGYYLYMYDKKEGATRSQEFKIPLHLTDKFWGTVTLEQLKEKLKSIKNVNELRPDNKRNMLHQLVLYGKQPEMIGLLIEAGVNYSHKDQEKWEGQLSSLKPLHRIFSREDKIYEFTKELLKYDKNIDETGLINDKGVPYLISPLMSAVYLKAPAKAIKLLLDKKADPNFKSAGQWTVLMFASVNNQSAWSQARVSPDPETIQLLLDYGANQTLKTQNIEGKTAYDYLKTNEEFTKTEFFKELSSQFQQDTNSL